MKLYLTLLFTFLSFPAQAGGRVTELHQDYFFREDLTVLTKSTFTIRLDEPGPLLVSTYGCEINEGHQAITLLATISQLEVKKFLLNGTPIEVVKHHKTGFGDKTKNCSTKQERKGVYKITPKDPDKIYPPGDYFFEIETVGDFIPSLRRGKEDFGTFVGDWVREKYAIEKASADIYLPEGYKVTDAHAVSALPSQKLVRMGREGVAIFSAARWEKITDSHYYFEATTELKPNVHEFIIGVEYYHPIFSGTRILENLASGFGVGTTTILNFFLAGFILIYFLVAWIFLLIRSRPRVEGLYTEAPFGFAPAHLNNIELGYADIRAMVATLVDMAIKGAIKIGYNGSNFVLTKKEKVFSLTMLEGEVFEGLFGTQRADLELNPSARGAEKILKKVFSQFTRGVSKESKFVSSKWGLTLFFVGVFLSFSALVFSFYITPWRGPNYYLMMGGYLVLACFYGLQIYAKVNLYSGQRLFFKIIFWLGTIGIVFFDYAAEAFDFIRGGHFSNEPLWEMAPLIFIVLINLVFLVPVGKKIANKEFSKQMAGYRQYLGETDTRILEAYLPFREDKAFFKKHLPYALALGLEKKWGRRFDSWDQDGKIGFEGEEKDFPWFENKTGSGGHVGFEDISTLLGCQLAGDLVQIIGGWRALLYFQIKRFLFRN